MSTAEVAVEKAETADRTEENTADTEHSSAGSASAEPRLRIIRDSAIVAHRTLLTIMRVPTLLVPATVQPLLFVFLFA